MRAVLACTADEGRGRGYCDPRRQLERVPEEDRIENAVRSEMHVQVPAAALLRWAAHAEVPRLYWLHEGAVHALPQWGACATQDLLHHHQREGLQSALCVRLHILLHVCCQARGRDRPAERLSRPGRCPPAANAGVHLYRLTGLMSTPHTSVVRASTACSGRSMPHLRSASMSVALQRARIWLTCDSSVRPCST